MFNKRTLAVVFAVCLVASALAGGGMAVAGAEETELPASYYGDVEINGDEAEPGVTIEVEIGGEIRGSITVDDAGEYGGPGALDGKLDVSGDTSADDGSAVTFHVEGDDFDRTEAETDPETVEWESGDIQQIDLEADAEIDTDPSPSPSPSPDPDPDPEPEVIDDPDEIRETVEVPDDVEPDRVERSEVAVDEETGQAGVEFSEESSVERITFDDDDVEGEVTVAEYESESASTGPSPGTSVSVTQISVPDEVADRGGSVDMRVPSDRLEENDIDAVDLRVNRFADGEWHGLETDVVDEDDRVLLSAHTPGFSFFSASAVSEPEAVIDLDPSTATIGETIELDGASSSDRYGEIVAYEWVVEGEQMAGDTVTTTFEEAGEYTVELTVTNDAGESNITTQALTIEDDEISDDVDDDDDFIPGFGVMAAITAFAASFLLLRRRLE